MLNEIKDNFINCIKNKNILILNILQTHKVSKYINIKMVIVSNILIMNEI